MRRPASRPWRRRAAVCAALLGLFGTAGGCEEERRVPYVGPELKNWARPYEGVPGLVLHVFETASVHGPEILMLRRGRMTKERRLPVLSFVLEHPRQGLVLWGTGPSASVGGEEAGPQIPLLGMKLLRVELGAEQELREQMEAAGLDPRAVRWVVLPNLGFLYAGQVEAFPDARVVVSRTEHRAARRGRQPYRTADFDEVASWKFVDLTEGKPLGTMPRAVDLFTDGSCLLLDAAGPTAGNLALLIRLPSRPVLLAADLAPTPETLRYAAEPAGLVDTDAWWDRIWRLKRFKDLDTNLLVIPGHDVEPIRTADLPEVRIHAYEPTEASAASTPTRPPAVLPGLR